MGLTAAWWRHQMQTLSELLALCAGNSPATGEFPAQRPVTRSFDVFFAWVNNREAGDLGRHRALHDVTWTPWRWYFLLIRDLNGSGYGCQINHIHTRLLAQIAKGIGFWECARLSLTNPIRWTYRDICGNFTVQTWKIEIWNLGIMYFYGKVLPFFSVCVPISYARIDIWLDPG